MKTFLCVVCALLMLVLAVPVEAGGNCNVSALQAFAGVSNFQSAQAVAGGGVVVQQPFQIQQQYAVQPVQIPIVAQPLFTVPTYAQTLVTVPVTTFSSVGHCGVSTFSSNRVFSNDNFRRSKSKAKSRTR